MPPPGRFPTKRRGRGCRRGSQLLKRAPSSPLPLSHLDDDTQLRALAGVAVRPHVVGHAVGKLACGWKKNGNPSPKALSYQYRGKNRFCTEVAGLEILGSRYYAVGGCALGTGFSRAASCASSRYCKRHISCHSPPPLLKPPKGLLM